MCVCSCLFFCHRLLQVCVCVCLCVFMCSVMTEPSVPVVPLPIQRLERLQQPASSSSFTETRQEAPPSWTGFLLHYPSHCAPVILLDDWIEMIGEENRFDETFNYRSYWRWILLVLTSVSYNQTAKAGCTPQYLWISDHTAIDFHIWLNLNLSFPHPLYSIVSW